ncbi:vitronectin [Bombina bombina]|uniref:vitronectin n=1 Tax=Bombina bombina TaxID=8345 RepID=UPI00235AFC93|nr:vitronectin [Bombina bombina]
MRALLLPALLLLGAIGTAQADEGSCDGRCDAGFDAAEKCQCDSLCTYYSSCCSDYISVCKPRETRGDIFETPEDYEYYEIVSGIPAVENSVDDVVTPYPDIKKTTTITEINGATETVSTPEPTTPEPTTDQHEEPSDKDKETCSGEPFNAFTKLKNGTTFAFRGKYVFGLDEDSVLNGYPKLIKDVFGIDGPIDAAFTRSNCQGKTYLFKGDKYWRFSDGVLDDDFPRDIDVGFDSIPNSIDAAFALPANNYKGKEKVYFFKGNKYWPYEFQKQPTWKECQGFSPSESFRSYATLQMDSWEEFFNQLFGPKIRVTKGPLYISRDWKGVPSGVDAVLPGRIYVPQQKKSPLRRSKRRKSRRRQNRMRKTTIIDMLLDDDDDIESDPDWVPWSITSLCKPVQNVYFFKKDKYYRVNLQRKSVDKVYPRYPRSIAKYWLGCNETISA